MINIISLGAGVQSSTMALMAKHGEITPMPDCAIFADTQAEPKSVYTWLDWLEKQLPFPVYRVTHGNLREHSLQNRISKRTGQVYTRNLIPFYIAKPNGKGGILKRKCTADYKILCIERKVKQLVKPKRKETSILATQWIGISLDEAHRMKPAVLPWSEHIWPLIDLRMTRQDCLKWMEAHGYPRPPRSACVFCPYHGNEEWLRLKTEEPEEFQSAVEFEKEAQRLNSMNTGTARLRGIAYLHDDKKPLDELDFVELVKTRPKRPSAFGNECAGMCGV